MFSKRWFFGPEKYDFEVFKGFSTKKMGQNSSDFFFIISRSPDFHDKFGYVGQEYRRILVFSTFMYSL
jgi:hypothetical protein